MAMFINLFVLMFNLYHAGYFYVLHLFSSNKLAEFNSLANRTVDNGVDPDQLDIYRLSMTKVYFCTYQLDTV